MLYIGSHVFEIVESPLKILKLKGISNEEMGPYRTEPYIKFSPAIAKAYKQSALDDLHYITKKIFNEGYYMSKKILRSLEALAVYYKFEDVVAWFNRYREKWSQVSFTNQLDIQEKNRVDVEYQNTKLIAEFKDEIMLSDLGKEMKDAKISYLEKENTNLSSCLEGIKVDCQHIEAYDCDNWAIDLYKEVNNYEQLKGKYRSNKITISYLQDKHNDKRIVVTDDMIALAKKVPFNKLLKLETVGNKERTKCPFHNEKTPSFYIYPDTNRGYCHGCGRSVDTIQYLVEIKKLKFNQAVIMLLSY